MSQPNTNATMTVANSTSRIENFAMPALWLPAREQGKPALASSTLCLLLLGLLLLGLLLLGLLLLGLLLLVRTMRKGCVRLTTLDVEYAANLSRESRSF